MLKFLYAAQRLENRSVVLILQRICCVQFHTGTSNSVNIKMKNLFLLIISIVQSHLNFLAQGTEVDKG